MPQKDVPKLREITSQRRSHERPNNNLCEEFESFNLRTTGNTSDSNPPKSDDFSRIFSYLGLSNPAQGYNLARVQKETTDAQNQLNTQRNNLNGIQRTLYGNAEQISWETREAESAITNFESELETLNSKEVWLRMAELPGEVEAHQKTLVAVEQTLSTTAQQVAELKNRQSDTTEDAITVLKSDLKVLNDIHTITETLTSAESLITQKYDTLYSKIAKLKDNTARNAALEAVYHTNDRKPENKALQAEAKTYTEDVHKVVMKEYKSLLEQNPLEHSLSKGKGSTDAETNIQPDSTESLFGRDTVQLLEVIFNESELETSKSTEIREQIVELPEQLKAYHDTLVGIKQTLPETAQKVDELRNWQGDNTIADFESRLNKLNEMKNDIRTTIESLSSRESLITERYDTLKSEIEKVEDDTVRGIFSETIDHMRLYNLETINQENKTLQEKSETYIAEVAAALADTSEQYKTFLEQNPQNPFFENEQRTDTVTDIQLGDTGSHAVNMVEAILKKQGSDKTVEDITKAFASHQHDGGIDENLAGIFSELGDQQRYTFGTVQIVGLGRVLEKALENKLPIIATLDNAKVVPEERHLSRDVMLVDFERGATIYQSHVTVLDGLTQNSYKIRADALVPVWTERVFAPAEVL